MNITLMSLRLILSIFVIAWPDALIANISVGSCDDQNLYRTLSSSTNQYVMADLLFARQEPNKNSKILSYLKQGQKIKLANEPKVFENDRLWTKIKFPSSTEAKLTGWVDSNYLSKNPLRHLSNIEKYKNIDFEFDEKVCAHKNNPRRKVRGIYLTMYSAFGKHLDRFLQLANRSSINSFVVDYKDELGKIIFKSETVKKMNPVQAKRVLIKDPKTLPERTKLENIYLIGKLVVFKDDSYARQFPASAIKHKDGRLFEDRDGIAWVNPYNREYWNYVLGIAEEMARSGVNEIQFDYIRFPDTNKPLLMSAEEKRARVEVIHEFLKEAYKRLKPHGVYVSADVFGLVPNTAGDLYIGQHWESLSSVIDYISPMMYPSHYSKGFASIKDPDMNPYDTIYHSARGAVNRSQKMTQPATIRPWIQGFTATWLRSHIKYGQTELQAQIDALASLGVDEYLIWNPGNRYENLLKQESNVSIDVADSASN